MVVIDTTEVPEVTAAEQIEEKKEGAQEGVDYEPKMETERDQSEQVIGQSE